MNQTMIIIKQKNLSLGKVHANVLCIDITILFSIIEEYMADGQR